MKGKIKWFDTKKAYGFIQGEDGQDYFVHVSELPEGVTPQENDEVTFEPAETERGKQAKKVEMGGE